MTTQDSLRTAIALVSAKCYLGTEGTAELLNELSIEEALHTFAVLIGMSAKLVEAVAELQGKTVSEVLTFIGTKVEEP